MAIFGLIGAPKAGKDMVAQFFVHRGYKRLAFADRIKEEYYEKTGYTENQFKNNRGEPIENEIREGLWTYSAKMKEKHGPLYFVAPIINEIRQTTKNIVVSDVRTLVEMKELLRLGTNFMLITKDFDKDCGGKTVPGTQIPPIYVEKYCSVFTNNYNTIEEAWEVLQKIVSYGRYEEAQG